MATEILDIVVRQKGARKVARDIGTIGVAANSANTALKGLQTSLTRTQAAMAKAKTSTQAATGAMRGLGAASVGAKRSLTALGTGVALVGGAITASLLKPLKAAITAAADFERAMNMAGVLIQIDRGSQAFKKLEERAKELGLTTQFTATQAAEGMQFLGKAGFSAKEVFDTIIPSLDLAAAANVGVARAADMATNILRGYQQTVEELPRSIDILASAFTSSNTDIQELSKAFEAAGPIAVRFGQRFEDVAATVAALADAGIKSQKSGIALRRIMINLQKDANKTNSILRQIGVSIVEIGDDGVERIRPLQDIFIDIANSVATGGQRIDLFGARALAAAGILDDASGGLEKYADLIASNVGRAAEVGAARLKGFWGAVTVLKSKLEGLGIAIAESGLLDFLIKVVKGLTKFVSAVSNLPKPILAFIGAAAGSVAILAAITLKVGLLIIAIAILSQAGLPSFIAMLGTATGALKAFTLFFLTNPIGIFIVAIGAAIAIIYSLRNEVITFGDDVFTVGDLVVVTWDAIVEAVIYANDWWDRLFSDMTGSLTDFETDLGSVLRFVQAFLNAVIAIPIAVGRMILAALNLIAKPLAAFISGVVEAIRDIPNLVKGALTGKDILTSITKPFVDAYNEVAIEAEDLVNDLGDIFTRDYLGEGGDLVLTLLDALELTDKTAERYLDRQKKRQKEFADANKPDRPSDRPGGGTVVPPGLGAEEIKSRSDAYVELIKSLLDLTSAEERLREAEITLNKAVEANVISAKEETVVFRYLGQQVYRELEDALFPVNALLKEQSDQLRELERVGLAAGISSDQLAISQNRVRENFEKSLVALEDWQEGLTAVESIQFGVIEGVNQFGESLGNAFTNIADLVEGTLDRSMDAVHEFVTTGKFDFKQFALEVIADIQKVILKLLVLGAMEAFQKKDEHGGGLLGAVKAFATSDTFGSFDRLGLPGAEEKAALGGGEAGTQANPLYTVGTNSADKPLATTLTDPEAPGIVSLRDAFTTSLKKANTLQIDKVTETNSILDSILTQLQTQGASGGLDLSSTNDLLNTGSERTAEGLVGVALSATTDNDMLQNSNQSGSEDVVQSVGNMGRDIASALASGGRMGEASTAFKIVKGLQMVTSLASSVYGAVGGGGGGAGGTGAAQAPSTYGFLETGAMAAQHGAQVRSGQVGSSFLVGERGPELFTPQRTGSIVPNGALNAPPPEIKVQVVNVDDPTSIPEAMGTRQGEKAVLNVIQRNRGVLREMLA